MAMAGRLAAAIAIAGASVLVARFLTTGLRRVRSRSGGGAPLIYIAERLIGYGVVLSGLLIGLSTLGVNLSSLTVFAGAAGVGAGLGLQGVVREFVSGLVVIFDPLVNVGDFVEFEDGVRGEIAEVGPRATRLRANDGLSIVIPNSKLIESRVLNWTHKGATRRIHVPFSVAYGVDKGRVRDAVLEAAMGLPFTLPDTPDRKTQVWMTGFGGSALAFELVVWPSIEAVRRPAAMHAAYTWAIDDALRKARIEVPFPQTDVRIRSLFGREGEEALSALGIGAGPGVERPHPTLQDQNDAAQAVVDDVKREAEERAARREDDH
jgi:small-conductance mechanosensitive channel